MIAVTRGDAGLRSRPFRTLAMVVALHSALSVSSFGQVISNESVDVNLVEVPVSVTTSNGEPVRGLAKENFEVYDQGKKVEITNFEMIDFAERAKNAVVAGAAFGTSPAASARNFMLLFDLGNSSPTSLLRVRSAAIAFVNEQVIPGDRVAVATIGPQDGFKLLTNFSTDRQLAVQAIDTLGAPQLHMAGDPLLFTVDHGDMATMAGGRTEGQEGKGPTAEDKAAMAEEYLQEVSLQSKNAMDQAQRQYVKRQLSDLASIGAALDKVPGRKQVILLSEGFDPRTLQGHATAANNIETQNEANASASGEIWKIDSDARFGSSSQRNDLDAMINALRRSDVVLNAIDISGLRGSDIGSAKGFQTAETKSNDSLFLLTGDTGGVVFRNTNNLKANFSQMLKTQEVTYVLAFNGATKKPGTFHNIKVKLVNVPKGKANYRVGYYEPRPVSNDMERLLTAGEIIMNSIPVNDVKVNAGATAFPSENAAQVPVVIETDGKSLLDAARGNVLTEEVYVYAFDDKEIIADYSHQKIDLDLAKTRDKIAAQGVKFMSTLDLPPGDYSVRILVVAGGMKNGFISVPLHVPGADEMYAAMAMNDPRQWLMIKPQQDAERAYPFALGEKVIVPAANAVVAGGPYEIALVTHGFGPTQVQIDAQVIDAAGKSSAAPLSLVGRTSPDDDGNVKLLLSLDPTKLAKGTYSLTLAVHGGDAEAVASAKMPFVVQ
jgi:VWFA-related protein